VVRVEDNRAVVRCVGEDPGIVCVGMCTGGARLLLRFKHSTWVACRRGPIVWTGSLGVV
jgi:hypothetical protein